MKTSLGETSSKGDGNGQGTNSTEPAGVQSHPIPLGLAGTASSALTGEYSIEEESAGPEFGNSQDEQQRSAGGGATDVLYDWSTFVGQDKTKALDEAAQFLPHLPAIVTSPDTKETSVLKDEKTVQIREGVLEEQDKGEPVMETSSPQILDVPGEIVYSSPKVKQEENEARMEGSPAGDGCMSR